MTPKHPKADLRSYHTILFELGLIVTLFFMIAATKANIQMEEEKLTFTGPEPDIEMVDIPPQTPPEKPPAPLKPSVVVEVPDDTPIDEPLLDFPEFEFGSSAIPLPPPQQKQDEDYIHESVEIMPQLKGGLNALYSKIEYPKVAKNIGIEGTVTIEFIINEEGKVTNPRIVRSLGGGCDEEVLRVIKLMEFTPGIQNGRMVKVKMHQNVRFRLQN